MILKNKMNLNIKKIKETANNPYEKILDKLENLTLLVKHSIKDKKENYPLNA